ncbi:hypothetical protein BB558_003159 [Smittium angustum]|uniref:Uncharacterized protein n=1 Tax=Smittium angustum TaxID=133377 RepID=A0A2U1J6R6_SMIAN|nr:hypothetical protein BB558_003159 [Smittium angustum]
MCDTKSALMNLVHTIPDEGIDDDTISKLMSVINITKDKISALIKGKSSADTLDKATMTTRIRDINNFFDTQKAPYPSLSVGSREHFELQYH